MTPKEKAVQIFENAHPSFYKLNYSRANYTRAVVTDILWEVRYGKRTEWIMYRKNTPDTLEYWKEVNQEIENQEQKT